MTNREYGMAALNLEMTDRVYRMEYSVMGHSALIKKVTGFDEVTTEVQRAFAKAWDMCMQWNIMVHNSYLGKYVTSMGHAVYAEGGTDRNDNVFTCFKDVDEVFAFDPYEKLPKYDKKDLTAQFNANWRNVENWIPDSVPMTGIYISCMSGLIEILGWDMLLTCAGDNPEKFGQLTDRYSLWIEQFFIALAESDTEVVMIHDDIVWTEGVFMYPEWYRKHIFPSFERCFSHLRKAGKKIMFTSDGTYTEFIDDIAACGVDSFVMEPTTDMAYISEKYGKRCGFVGNADTRILLMGSRDDIYNEVKRCMDIGKKCPGFIMSVGNHIPANTPVDNCLWYDEFCKELGKR